MLLRQLTLLKVKKRCLSWPVHVEVKLKGVAIAPKVQAGAGLGATVGVVVW